MTEWLKLDAKVMLIGPIGALRQFLFPAVIALIGFGTQQPRWALIAAPFIVLGSVALGVVPWFTTRYRIADGQLVVTTGLVNKKRLTAPLDRIRGVDLEATLLHRLLGLQKVEIGTGVDDTMIELDALSVDRAAELRGVLLSRRAVEPTAPSDVNVEVEVEVEAPAAPAGQDLVAFSPAWARFAPLSLGRLAVALGVLGAASQFAGDLRLDVHPSQVWERIVETSLVVLVLGLLLGALVAWTALSMAAYLVQWWGMRLVREDGNLRLTRGLFTTQSTTIEEARIRGVRLRETALLRSVDGGELHALVTGLDEAVYAVLPQAPARESRAVAADVLGDDAPIQVPLGEHGPRARRRARTRNMLLVLPLVAPVVGLVVLLEGWESSTVAPALAWAAGAVAVLVLLGLLLGRAEYAHLGHALTERHVVAGSGITSRTRTVLQRDGIIGWVISQNLFQRRRGLATLVATTAAGSEQVRIRDLPLAAALDLAADATPGMLDEFLVQPDPAVV